MAVELTRAAVAAADRTDQTAAILALPEHLRDALRRTDAAGVEPRPSAGLVIAGMGGSGVGALLAQAAVGPRATKPIVAVRDYSLPAYVDEHWTVLLSSYSGNTEETLAGWDAAGEAGARRIAVTTGGALAERAREAAVPIIALPEGLQPRAGVGYATAVALEVIALAGAAPSVRGEIEAAADAVEALAGEWGPDAPADALPKVLAGELTDAVPVFTGAGLTAPVAYRWKCQINENANRPAFWSELPEADHNEIEGWGDRGVLLPVFLEDPVDTHPRTQRRFELTAEIIGGVRRVRAEGDSRVERLMRLVHLGDLASLYLAVLVGADPVDIPALVRLKSEL